MTEHPQAIVLFDANCPFCRKGISLLRRLDWLKRLEFRNMREESNWPETQTSLSMQRMDEEMHLVTPDGQVLAGFSAFRWIAWKLPLTIGIVPLLYIPGVLEIGNRAYRYIAKNRYSLVACHDGVCAIPAKRAV